jgi:outer membrane lipoprotein carrier protein
MTKQPRFSPSSLRTAAMLVACCLVCFSGASARAITGAEVMEKARTRFGEYKSFSARFDKEFYWAALDRTSTRHGRMYLRRPNLFRVELEGGGLVVADGSAIWSYSKRNQQVLVSPYQGELQTPWEVLVDYSMRYAPVAVDEVELGKHRCFMLVLTPDGVASAEAQMKIWVDRKHWYLRRVEQHEAAGNTTTYTLRDFRINKELADDLFDFLPPEGTEVIDRRPLTPTED